MAQVFFVEQRESSAVLGTENNPILMLAGLERRIGTGHFLWLLNVLHFPANVFR